MNVQCTKEKAESPVHLGNEPLISREKVLRMHLDYFPKE